MDKELKQKLLRQLPSVTVLLQQEGIQKLIKEYSHDLVVKAANEVLAQRRQRILQGKVPGEPAGQHKAGELASPAGKSPSSGAGGQPSPTGNSNRPGNSPSSKAPGLAYFEEAIARHLAQRFAPRLRRVVNATGVVLHTNLGRALLSETALEAVAGVGNGYTNLELDLETGERGSRYVHVEKLLCELTGAEGAMVVNNNAAAVLLVLNTLAQGKEVIVSRGQLVEIGGSFRIPEVMKASGAKLVEVGTTNKTHLRDYREAITEETALLLKVHTSNYKITGFTAEVALTDLVELGKEKGIPVVEDLGSGVLVDLSGYGLPAEPTVRESIAAGADIVTFSGDKLFGGPQAGIIVGKAKYIEALKKNQLTRALRVDKLTFAALEATLKLYLDEELALEQIPTLRMLVMPLKAIEKRAKNFAARLRRELARRGAPGPEGGRETGGEPGYPGHGPVEVLVIDGSSQVGGGAMPTAELPTKLVAIEAGELSVARLEANLRTLAEIPVLVRVQKNRLLIDLRTVQPGEEGLLIKILAEKILGGGAAGGSHQRP